uniref:Truncated oligoadenylate synthetase 1b n=1 Tax=Mus musculus castaneus TaxID=10091 RepID=A8YPE3_MUSMC|nr:truncated oligoadenylate synthetase 1b [Mus musculus castaneus]
MEQDLRSIPASKLDKFIENHLPDTSFCADLREVIDSLCALLKDRSFQGPVRRMGPLRGSRANAPRSRAGQTLTWWCSLTISPTLRIS